VMVKLF
jgi:hypothetical protein